MARREAPKAIRAFGQLKKNKSRIAMPLRKKLKLQSGLVHGIMCVYDEKTLNMHICERGSGETLACGTGACAVVAAAVANGICKKNDDITVNLRGGVLMIKYTDEAVYMTGGAETVFEGEVKV